MSLRVLYASIKQSMMVQRAERRVDPNLWNTGRITHYAVQPKARAAPATTPHSDHRCTARAIGMHACRMNKINERPNKLSDHSAAWSAMSRHGGVLDNLRSGSKLAQCQVYDKD